MSEGDQRVMTERDEYETAAIVLIERDDTVPVPMRALAALMSFALAGPSNDASMAVRDQAMDEVREAIVSHFKEKYGDRAAMSTDGEGTNDG